ATSGHFLSSFVPERRRVMPDTFAASGLDQKRIGGYVSASGLRAVCGQMSRKAHWPQAIYEGRASKSRTRIRADTSRTPSSVRAQPLLFVLAGEETFRHPGRAEGGDHVVLGGGQPFRPRAEVRLHRLVHRAAVDDAVMHEERDLEPMDVLVLERAGPIVVDLP